MRLKPNQSILVVATRFYWGHGLIKSQDSQDSRDSNACARGVHCRTSTAVSTWSFLLGSKLKIGIPVSDLERRFGYGRRASVVDVDGDGDGDDWKTVSILK